MGEDSPGRRFLVWLGLVHPSGEEPLHGAKGTSRYGVGQHTSVRLDQDVDALRARVEALERRLGTEDERPDGST
ncbi:hypothetical protein [Pseudokineococcus sp. 1T1Z-3]|uniref:hypothetical protein n=1 Tax=Pseudokineococcus sp. 1T1Z-3 TaxID=3132745 RepID=UPI0030B59155